VPYPDVARWVNTASGKAGADRSQARLQALQYVQRLKEDFIYLITFSNLSNGGILIHFYVAVFKAIFVNVLLLVVAVLR
jgi:hypothetical protein